MPVSIGRPLVLAIGSASLFFSHLNDAGFRLIKAFVGMSGRDPIRSRSVVATVISVVCVLLVLVAGVVV
jgi:GntP family gluconate:H+ symporter